MRGARTAGLSMLAAIGAILQPLLTSTASVLAASPRTALPIGRQLSELKGSHSVGHWPSRAVPSSWVNSDTRRTPARQTCSRPERPGRDTDHSAHASRRCTQCVPAQCLSVTACIVST
jgi:hypothetical protein